MRIPGFILIFLCITITSSAQIERTPSPSLRKDTAQAVDSKNTVDRQSRKELMRELDLTPEQKGKMKELMQSNKATKEAIENNDQLSEQEKRKQLREMQKNMVQKVQLILTPEQFEKFKQNLMSRAKNNRQSNP